MKQRTLILLLILVAAGCAPAPTPAPTPTPLTFPSPTVRLGGKVVYLPGVRVADFRWQRTGYGRPYGAIGRDPELHDRGVWSYSWGLGNCLDIPMVFSDMQMPPRWALERCAAVSDVLLVFNEPEYASQANMTPAAAAKTLHDLEQHWPGELWCCGNLVASHGWFERMMIAYKAAYRTTPRLAGVHVHVYVAGGLPGIEHPDDGRWLAQSQANFRAYLEVMRRWNIPPRVVVSECCLLGKYPEGVYLKVQEAYMRWMRSERAVESIAWFSARYAGFPDANLLERGGGLTAVGHNWLDWRWK